MGLGVVGGGVANALLNDAQSMALKVGCPVDLRRVLVRDASRPRSVESAPCDADNRCPRGPERRERIHCG